MALTEGQRLAREQIQRLNNRPDGPLRLVSITDPRDDYKWLTLDVSLDCRQFERREGGLPLHPRERLKICVDPDFPFVYPDVWVTHVRFAGFPHVQWRRHLCLYQAPQTEWDPSDGLFGLFERLEYWLAQGAKGELDPIGGALHPPAIYLPKGPIRNVVVRANTPVVTNVPWNGLVEMTMHGDHRVDVLAWRGLAEPANPESVIGAAILLAEPMPFEFPKKAIDLFREFEGRGTPRASLLALLEIAALHGQDDQSLYVLLGAPMRGISGEDERRQHLTAWTIQPEIVKGLRTAIRAHGLMACATTKTWNRVASLADDIEKLVIAWLETTDVAWCHILEQRDEIVERRDVNTAMTSFRGKRVALWGCGALGSYVAPMLARAGVAAIDLYDNKIVTPGVLVRQNYDDKDIGLAKVDALKSQLNAIDPQLEANVHSENLITKTLSSDGWCEDMDVIIDTTASGHVHKKLEAIWARTERRPILASMMVSAGATAGLATLASSTSAGASLDVLRKLKLQLARRPYASAYSEAFWPREPAGYFQPEPGCSDPTFVASSADIASLGATLINHIARDLDGINEVHAVAHVCANGLAAKQPHLRLCFLPDIVSEDPALGYQIHLSASAWQSIQGWVRRSHRTADLRDETGGVLFGQRDDAAGVIWISEASGPPPDSEASPEGFVCGVEGVAALNDEKSQRSQKSVQYLGMWHTHPNGLATPSPIDFAGMGRLLVDSSTKANKHLMMIVGQRADPPELGFYLFDRDERNKYLRADPAIRIYVEGAMVGAPERTPARRDLGLALSGGGFRAIAFHLGCLRALHDLGLLEDVDVVSGVSGGAVLAAAYAYSDEPFEAFDERIRALLAKGLARKIAQHAFLSRRAIASAMTALTSLPAALLANTARVSLEQLFAIIGRRSHVRPDWIDQIQPPLRRWSSRTLALSDTLAELLFDDAKMSNPRRHDINVVINACELRTGAAFRFGSRESGCWRYGSICDNDVHVADAVSMSAAYPVFFPAIDTVYDFYRAKR